MPAAWHQFPNLHLAGARFERLLKELMTAKAE
jgi:hypothetical protein